MKPLPFSTVFYTTVTHTHRVSRVFERRKTVIANGLKLLREDKVQIDENIRIYY